VKIGLVGASYQAWSLPFNAERCVNLYPVLDQRGKEVAALYGTPGLELFGTAGAGATRGAFASQNGRAFFVSGSSLYEIDNAGTTTIRGSLLQSSGNVSMAENPTQLAICDGAAVYIFTYSSNAYAQVSDVDLPTSGTITFLDGYFIVNRVGTGSFFISALNDGTSWAALDFATAESSPDSLLRVFNALGQLYLFGETTTELYTNTGASAFPFQRISGGKMEVGILAPYTAIAIENSVIWLGKDNFGKASVYRARGISPTKISTEAIDLIFQAAANPEDIVAFAYQQQGHVFVVFTGGGLTTSPTLDITTNLWHERAYLNEEGAYEQHRAYCGLYAFGKHLVGDREDGNIYSMDMDIYADNGDAILRERIYTHLIDENKRIRYSNLNIGFETGTGLQSGQGSDPLCSLQLSRDGAKTWSTSYTTTIGAVGKYQTEVNFRRLGIAQQMTFRLQISDPVKIAICGSYLNV
jgi:hypothetical protein